MPHYYANEPIKDELGITTGYKCRNDSSSPERHPLRWFITRQICSILWYVGEIIADWYPLLRTKAVVQNNKSIWFVYFSCCLFNISKLILIGIHLKLSPAELYDEHGVYDVEKVNLFYFYYWAIQLLIIYTSAFYDFTVYYVLKKVVFVHSNNTNIGFLKKFKSISEYRILISALVNFIFLPIVSVTIIMKFYYYYKYGYSNLNFSFDEIRKSIANLQYYMIFIDQILLLHSRNESTNVSSYININSGKNSTNDESYKNLTSSKGYHHHTLNSSSNDSTLTGGSQNNVQELNNFVGSNMINYMNNNKNSYNSNNDIFYLKRNKSQEVSMSVLMNKEWNQY